MFTRKTTIHSETDIQSIKIEIYVNLLSGINKVSGSEYKVNDADIRFYGNQNFFKSSLLTLDFSMLPRLQSNTAVSVSFVQKGISHHLPENISINLIQFFNYYNFLDRNSCYSCLHFGYQLFYGLNYVQEVSEKNTTRSRPFNENNLALGSLIGLFNDAGEFHFAIYIGLEHYLSMFGNFGPLMITTLPEMKKAFDCPFVFEIDDMKLSKEDLLPFIQAREILSNQEEMGNSKTINNCWPV